MKQPGGYYCKNGGLHNNYKITTKSTNCPLLKYVLYVLSVVQCIWVNSAANIKTEVRAYFTIAILNKYL